MLSLGNKPIWTPSNIIVLLWVGSWQNIKIENFEVVIRLTYIVHAIGANQL
jgi:hypothetical protein